MGCGPIARSGLPGSSTPGGVGADGCLQRGKAVHILPRVGSPMKKIETLRSRVPWSWVAWMTGPWMALYYIDNLSDGGPLTFTIRKYIEDPVWIGFLGSIHVGFNFTVGAGASYLSDRIWTSAGRRRPFLITGWIGVAAAMLGIALAPNVWTLVTFIVAMHFFASIAKPVEPLFNEVVPPGQRGRAGTMRNVAQQLMGLLFFAGVMAQFDQTHTWSAFSRVFQMRGETVAYVVGAAITGGMALFLLFGVRENPPPACPTDPAMGTRGFLRDVFGRRQWWMVYLLYVSPLVAGPMGGGFTRLMQTEQLGFTKAEVGFAVSVGIVVMIAIFAPLGGYLADHMSRMRLLRIGIIGPAIVEFVLFLYLRYVADYSISLGTFIGFGLVGGALKTFAYLVWGALVFDYIPRNRFGTVSAGLTFVAGLTMFAITNLSGLWVAQFTRLFGAAGKSRYDYSSLYVLQAGCALLALGITYYFEREERRGRVVALGRQEVEETR